jgi:hypothetical protein
MRIRKAVSCGPNTEIEHSDGGTSVPCGNNTDDWNESIDKYHGDAAELDLEVKLISYST